MNVQRLSIDILALSMDGPQGGTEAGAGKAGAGQHLYIAGGLVKLPSDRWQSSESIKIQRLSFLKVWHARGSKFERLRSRKFTKFGTCKC